jgi:hypothetical protein
LLNVFRWNSQPTQNRRALTARHGTGGIRPAAVSSTYARSSVAYRRLRRSALRIST